MEYSFHKKNGFVSIIAIMILSLVGMSIILAFLSLSTSSLREWPSEYGAERARFASEGCGEIALLSLSEDPSYSGDENYDFGESTCSSHTENGIIETVGEAAENIVRIQITTLTASDTPIIVNSWSPVTDF